MKPKIDVVDVLEVFGWTVLWVAAAVCLAGVGYYFAQWVDVTFGVLESFETALMKLSMWWHRG